MALTEDLKKFIEDAKAGKSVAELIA